MQNILAKYPCQISLSTVLVNLNYLPCLSLILWFIPCRDLLPPSQSSRESLDIVFKIPGKIQLEISLLTKAFPSFSGLFPVAVYYPPANPQVIKYRCQTSWLNILAKYTCQISLSTVLANLNSLVYSPSWSITHQPIATSPHQVDQLSFNNGAICKSVNICRCK